MKKWHIVVIVLIAYVIGAAFPGPLDFAKSKVGL